MRFVLTPWVRANLRTWVLPRPNRRMMSETGIPVLRQVAAQAFRLLRHSLVHLRFGKALGGVGFDAGYRVTHTEIVKASVGITELLAYLRHCIKVVSGTFAVRERVTHGLLVVCRRNELPFFRAALGLVLSLLSGKFRILYVLSVTVHFLLFSLFLLPCED